MGPLGQVAMEKPSGPRQMEPSATVEQFELVMGHFNNPRGKNTQLPVRMPLSPAKR